MLGLGGMAKTLEELPVYQLSLELAAVVTAILEEPAFGRNLKLRDQIATAMDSVLANMAEGFEGPTDASLQHYLFIAKASAAEVRTRVDAAHRRRFVTAERCATCTALARSVERMLGGWIKYLARCGWQDRGRRGLASPPRHRRS